ncbi:Ger(x)C family spore germination protein [Paenibacillus planticolens]|uniref:Ger(X)C family spore germination protein n=1 Tax=Paenibacillus planticolens TaxID=2654976 RepID=A0ABX1ZNV5_9BACL|nr:Ger(x)C family spore germination protein [Paenibacillus planticolens]NOV01757.1 Ger(x)C family spore germination protein [Paenibacillus planticolens]
MNKRWLGLLLIAVMISSSGCNDRLDLEDAAFPLLAGFDLDEKNNLRTYVALPVFSNSARKKTYKLAVTAQSLGQTRQESDAHWPTVFQGRKLLVMLVSKRLVEHDDWFRILDVFSRDAKNPLTSRLILYDGPLSELVFLNQKDEPFLPLLLRGMVDTKSGRSETVKTTFQDMHRLRFEKGKTPSIAEVRLDHEIRLSGSALLDHGGKYVDSLDAQETILMKILQNEAKSAVSLTLAIPGHPKRGPLNADRLSFNTDKVKTTIKTYFHDDNFQFDFAVRLSVGLTERLFPYDVKNKSAELEKAIALELQKQLVRLISKIQSHRIDPIGLGIQAQAFAYKPYKKVEDQWGEVLSQAAINVTVKVSIDNMGAVK